MLTLHLTTLQAGREVTLSRIEVVNDLTGTPERGNYRVTVVQEGQRPARVWVEGHARADGALRLAYEALGAYLHATAPPDPRLAQLTPRQRDVAARICQGLTTPQIAQDLGLSLNTVKTYLRQLYQLFGVHSRLQLIVLLGRAPLSTGDPCPSP